VTPLRLNKRAPEGAQKFFVKNPKKNEKRLLTSEAASDYIRLINEGGAPLATASFALELP